MKVEPADAYAAAAASEAEYVVALGTVGFDSDALPSTLEADAEPPIEVPVEVSGHLLTGAGFETAFDETVRARVTCSGPWCGTLENGATHLMFLEKTPEGLTLDLTPCPEKVFANPGEAVLQSISACFAKGAGCDRP